MLQFSIKHIGNDLHVPMRVRSKALTGCDAIFIHDTQ